MPRLVLLSAPAGFGKTTLLAQWLAPGLVNDLDELAGPSVLATFEMRIVIPEVLHAVTLRPASRRPARIRREAVTFVLTTARAAS